MGSLKRLVVRLIVIAIAVSLYLLRGHSWKEGLMHGLVLLLAFYLFDSYEKFEKNREKNKSR